MACGPKCRGGVEVGDEGGNDSGFGYYLVFEDAIADFEAGDEATGVDFQIPGVAWAVEWDDDFFVGNIENAKGNVGAVSPRAAMIGVEGYWESVSSGESDGAGGGTCTLGADAIAGGCSVGDADDGWSGHTFMRRL